VGRKVLLGAAVVIAATLMVTASRKALPRGAMVRAGPTPAPEFIFEYADGRVERLSSLRGKPVLLSFIDTREQNTDNTDNPDMSRRLLVFIQSMQNQYSGRGLTVLLVDGSPPAGVEAPDRLVNFRFDHDLVGTPMLSGDAARRAMRQFRVRSLPTTLLIGPQGQVNSRWEGLVLPSTLAKAIASQGAH
jgi:hypothetical protein